MINEFLNIYESGLKDGQNSLTQTEAVHRLSEKINLLIYHFNLLEDNCNTSIKDFSEKVEYYLNNGMIDEVSKKLDEFVDDGTLNEIINKKIFDDINEQIKIIKSDINNLSASSIISLSMSIIISLHFSSNSADDVIPMLPLDVNLSVTLLF